MKSAETEPAAPAPAEIHDRGRGPEIKGTRITVFDVLDYALACWPPERIATLFDIRTDQVEAAVDYIREHKIEVLKAYVEILERCERGNPPELEARLDARHAQFQELVTAIRAVDARAKEVMHDLIRKYRERPVEEGAEAVLVVEARHGR
jgi:uncharacterized protein (DUF433 family)